MFWADKILKERKGKEWVNDAWTPSGIIHMGGLKGPVIHDTLYKILKKQGRDARYTFGFDDFDPIDGLPQDLKESHSKYMGVPISVAPSPDGNGTFGDYFGNKMRALFKELDVQAEIYLASEYYKKGVYNKAIAYVLDNTEKIRKVYEEMYKKPVRQDWHPLQVVCSNCGKLGTTKVTSWDGKGVSFVCEPNLVSWATGCGANGKISPFDGNAKMPFKVEWAAKWWTFKVTIEGAGKDHASAGGTYDIARKICKDVFGQEPPLKLPYEFFLWEGKKMSSSKGLGLTGEELLELLPAELVRFLMIKNEPNHAVEFNPSERTLIPNLYDEYQQYAESYFEKKEDDYARVFELSQVGALKRPPNVRFATLAQWVQMPNMQDRIKEEKAEDWAKYARVWVEKYAPESERFLVKEDLPSEASVLSDKQREFLNKIIEIITASKEAKELEVKLYESAKEVGLPTKDAFAAIYLSLLGKPNGPKASFLLLSIDGEFVKNRFLEVVCEKR